MRPLQLAYMKQVLFYIYLFDLFYFFQITIFSGFSLS